MAITNIFGRDFYQGTDADMATCVPRIDGALFWTTDTLKLYCYSGAAWNEVGVGAGGGVATDAIWDAKGDLAVGTGADTAAKLTVGADGKIIYADSGEATGLVWDDPPAVATDAIWDAKGDIAAGTGANTASKLTVGADGKYLKADSGEATGLVWDVLADHDHSGDAGDGGTFDAANLTAGASTDGQVLTSDGAGGAAWEDAAAGTSVATDAIWDAKGDLAVGTGANTASKLTVGGDDTYLIADSGEVTGAKWSALLDHDHSGDAGDGGTFDAANLTAGASTDGQVLTSDGAGGAAWEDVPAAGGSIPANGWLTADAMTYASADDPTYTATVSGDKSATYQAGQRIKLSQSTGGTKYFIITKVAVSGDTTLTLYGGTDYNLENEAISSPYYSPVKAPFGFPVDPLKWSVEATDTNIRSQATPVQNTWYNLGTASLSVPIGSWRISYHCSAQLSDTTSATYYLATTLSTANNSESDISLSCRFTSSANTVISGSVGNDKCILLAAKTSYYLNIRTEGAGVDTIYLRGDVQTTVIRAVCGYL